MNTKPALDVRFGEGSVTSRAGLSQKADFLIQKETDILRLPLKEKRVHCILVDEVQFFEPTQIDQLRQITLSWNVPVICYGLRTDFRTNLFPGSKRLLELADSIEEVTRRIPFSTPSPSLRAPLMISISFDSLLYSKLGQDHLLLLQQEGGAEPQARQWSGRHFGSRSAARRRGEVLPYLLSMLSQAAGPGQPEPC